MVVRQKQEQCSQFLAVLLFGGLPSGMLGHMSEATPSTAGGVRARVRAELTAAIKERARAQLAESGAAAINLRAIARDLDMASSAIYRYYASRDEVLTALIIDAYDAVGAAVEAADAEHPRDAHRDRLIAMAIALRTWVQEHPHEYALIYGSPVPGYEAPQDTIDPAARVPRALLMLFVEHWMGRDVEADRPPELAHALADLERATGGLVSLAVLADAVDAWAQLFGLLSLELFGHMNNSVAPDDTFYRSSVERLADRILR